LPPEYVELVLCRDVYHCRPSELDEEDDERVAAHLICLEVEEAVRKRREKTGKDK
jgi:hypothetical protein